MTRLDSYPKKPGLSVLVVDDSEIIRKMLAAAFLSDGFKRCFEADNGKHGIEVAQQFKPDLITLDLSMPVMNGLQAAHDLRKLFPGTPIILFSLYADQLLSEEAARARINLVLSKNVSLSILVSKAHELMGR